MNAAASPSAPDTKACATCKEPIAGGQKALVCRGCGYIVHESCHKGAKLCPKCTKPLVTPTQASGFAESRAQAKRQVEYRLAALMTICMLIVVPAAAGLQFVTGAWEGGWLAIPFGTWIHSAIGIFVILTAAAFVRLRHPGIAITGLLLSSLMAVGFMPGANVCLGSILLGAPGLIVKIILLVTAVPLCIVLGAWWEYGKWKQIPGDSGGIRLKRDESGWGAAMEAIASGLPAAVSLWLLLIPQKRKQNKAD